MSKWQDIPKEDISIDGGDIDICIGGDDCGNNYCTIKKADMLDLLGCGWISIKDRLPEKHIGVYAYDKNHGMLIMSFDGKWFSDHNNIYDDVTHWMPLPEPPND